MRVIVTSALVASFAFCGVLPEAMAQGRRHVGNTVDASGLNTLPLTVNRRSWLDSGNTVHSGSVAGGQSYMSASTIYNKTPDHAFGPDQFGNDVISGQPYVPGRSVPVIEFSSLPNGGATVENVLGRQNYYFDAAAPQLPRNAAAVDVFPNR